MALSLSGCASTERELLTGQIALYQQAVAASEKSVSDLQNGAPGSFRIKAFVSYASLNKALAVLNGATFQLPSDASTTVTIVSAQVSGFGSLPTVMLSGRAERGSLKASVVMQAVLLPGAQPGKMKIGLVSFVPDVRWSFLEITKIKFVRDLLAVKVADLANKLPDIDLPVEQDVNLGGPATSSSFTFRVTDKPADMTVRVDMPSTLWAARITGERYYFMPNGVYIFGDVK